MYIAAVCADVGWHTLPSHDGLSPGAVADNVRSTIPCSENQHLLLTLFSKYNETEHVELKTWFAPINNNFCGLNLQLHR